MAQAVSQARDFDADDCVGSRVERLATAERLGPDGVLLELVCLTRERPFQEEPQRAPDRPAPWNARLARIRSSSRSTSSLAIGASDIRTAAHLTSPEVAESITYVTPWSPLRTGAGPVHARTLHACAHPCWPCWRLPHSLSRCSRKPVPVIALTNGRWFDGNTFQPADRLQRQWIVPLREAGADRPDPRPGRAPGSSRRSPKPHNHNIDGAVEARSLAAIRKYVADGVFYVKIQGNYPLTDEQRRRLPINRPGAPDVAFAQAFITATGGHPTVAARGDPAAAGVDHPGHRQGRAARHGSISRSIRERELHATWPRSIRALRPDFIKTNLRGPDEFDSRRSDPAFAGRKASIPRYCA